MNKLNKTVIALLATIGLTGAALAASGDYCDRSGKSGHRGAHMLKKMGEKLDLNDSQTAQLEALKEKIKETKMAKREGKADKKAAFMALFGDRFDESQAINMLQQRATDMNQNAPEMIAAFGSFYNALDAGQRDKLREMVQKRGGFSWMGFGGRGHHKKGGKRNKAERSDS